MKYKGPIESKVPNPVLNPDAQSGRSFFLFEARMSAKETVFGGAAALPGMAEICNKIPLFQFKEAEIRELTHRVDPVDSNRAILTKWTNVPQNKKGK